MSLLQNIFNSELIVSVIGGLIAGGFAILAVYKTFEKQNKRDEKNQQEIIKGVLKAIYEELKQTSDLLFDGPYVENFMQEIEKDPKKIFRLVFPISQDYLTIYRSNANLIGQINDPPDLRPKIVRTYVYLQVLIETYRANNEMLGEYHLTQNRFQRIAQALKRHHTRFQKSREEVFRILEEKYNISDSVDDST